MSDPVQEGYKAMEAAKAIAALQGPLEKTAAAFEALRALLPPAGSMAAGPRLSPMPLRKRRRLAVRSARRANR